MAGSDARELAETIWKAFEAGDWERAAEHLHDDFVQEWPQSGERIVGKDNAIAINQNFPGGLPKMRFRRTVASGDLAVLEVVLEYADGSVYDGVSIMEIRDGKVTKETDYFGQPFAAPQWRAQWVERF
ncbi:MAG TPA: nuclear transport factor 2 family protein [Actinomycetota bacterium]|nr:nuclear transport factor 2 family protein [Actinomycetota bacterium]